LPPPDGPAILGGMGNITRPFQFLKLVAAGAVATAVGVWLLVNPNPGMHEGPPPAAAD
jgi:hypothetical protein